MESSEHKVSALDAKLKAEGEHEVFRQQPLNTLLLSSPRGSSPSA